MTYRADESRRLRERNIADRVLGENGRWFAPNCPADKHGTYSGFTYWMCQCGLCLDACEARRRIRVAERKHNDAIIARLDAERARTSEASVLPQQDPPVPEDEEPTNEQRTGPSPVARETPPLVKVPAAGSSSPGLLDGLPVPEMTPPARSAVRSVEHLRQIVHAYHEPELTMTMPFDRERRAGHGVVLTLASYGAVLSVNDQEHAAGPSELLRDRGPVQRYGKRGPSGSRNPTTWAELKTRLKELGCTVEQGSTHVKVHLPDGRVTTLPSTASDWRALANQVSVLRSLGLDVRRTG